jgi:hypothetical protein
MLIASATTAAGGSAVLSLETPVELGVFVGGISAVCWAAYWLGGNVQKLIGRLDKGEERFERLEKRMKDMEEKCLILHPPGAAQSQRIEGVPK